jgi:hypothetical protein
MALHNYAMNDIAVERRILPLAADPAVAVIVNQLFGGDVRHAWNRAASPHDRLLSN